MLTLKFEADPCVQNGNGSATMMLEARKFRTQQQKDGSVDIFVENENGVEISYPVGHGAGTFHQCFVMNSTGQTVGCYRPMTNEPISQSSASP